MLFSARSQTPSANSSARTVGSGTTLNTIPGMSPGARDGQDCASSPAARRARTSLSRRRRWRRAIARRFCPAGGVPRATTPIVAISSAGAYGPRVVITTVASSGAAIAASWRRAIRLGEMLAGSRIESYVYLTSRAVSGRPSLKRKPWRKWNTSVVGVGRSSSRPGRRETDHAHRPLPAHRRPARPCAKKSRRS